MTISVCLCVEYALQGLLYVHLLGGQPLNMNSLGVCFQLIQPCGRQLS